jgi:HPt (histidine-containing phosphotransfer) domain-containing protein
MGEQQKLYDTTTIEMISKTNPAFLNQMIKMFVDLVSKDMDTLRHSAASNDWINVGQMAHKIKSAAGNMGVSSVLPSIRALETGSGDRIENLKALEENMAAVIAQMKNDYAFLFE